MCSPFQPCDGIIGDISPRFDFAAMVPHSGEISAGSNQKRMKLVDRSVRIGCELKPAPQSLPRGVAPFPDASA
jgi:hypothetical protein